MIEFLCDEPPKQHADLRAVDYSCGRWTDEERSTLRLKYKVARARIAKKVVHLVPYCKRRKVTWVSLRIARDLLADLSRFCTAASGSDNPTPVPSEFADLVAESPLLPYLRVLLPSRSRARSP